jgi:hypothetical protein
VTRIVDPCHRNTAPLCGVFSTFYDADESVCYRDFN